MAEATLFGLEPLLYPLDGPWPADHRGSRCRDCHRPLAGRWLDGFAASSDAGLYALCDECKSTSSEGSDR